MARFDSVAVLRRVGVTLDAAGNPTETVTDREVFVNRYTVGLSTWLAARNAGLHADSEISLRSLDYCGEQRVVLDDTEYEVERASNTGEFTTLTLMRRLVNG